MQEFKCRACGAPLTHKHGNQFKCEYCGSVYAIEGSNSYTIPPFATLEIEHPKIERLAAQLELPWEAKRYMGDEAATKSAISELTRQLAGGLAAYMRLDVQEDPMRMATVIRGTVRIVPPGFRF